MDKSDRTTWGNCSAHKQWVKLRQRLFWRASREKTQVRVWERLIIQMGLEELERSFTNFNQGIPSPALTGCINGVTFLFFWETRKGLKGEQFYTKYKKLRFFLSCFSCCTCVISAVHGTSGCFFTLTTSKVYGGRTTVREELWVLTDHWLIAIFDIINDK